LQIQIPKHDTSEFAMGETDGIIKNLLTKSTEDRPAQPISSIAETFLSR